MRVLLNMTQLTTGGGRRVAQGFIDGLRKEAGKDHRWFILGDETLIERLPHQQNVDFVALSCNVSSASRQLRVRLATRRLMRSRSLDVACTLLGTVVPGASRVPRVVGSAYSNLYDPSVDFWGHLPFLSRQLRRAKDSSRLAATLQADGWFFETPYLADRAMELFGLPPERVEVIPPHRPIFSVNEVPRGRELPEGFRVLLLSGWHPNKRWHLLPGIAAAARSERRGGRVVFLLTASPDDPRSRALSLEAAKAGVADRIHFIGTVVSEDLAALYRQVDAVMLLSRLESFSNNISEAWASRRPLIVADHLWARNICGQAAIYVDATNPSTVASHIDRLVHDPDFREQLVERGIKMLDLLPTTDNRVDLIASFVQRIALMGPK